MKKTNNKYISIILILAIIISITIAVILFNKSNNDKQLDSNISELYISPEDYIFKKLNGNTLVRNKAKFLNSLYVNDEVFKNYTNVLGKEFINEFQVTSNSGDKIDIISGNNKILVFTDTLIENLDQKIAEYLYLGALAKDANMYDLHVINTNIETFTNYINKYNMSMLNQPTAEIIEFLEIYPDNVVFFIDSNNTIELVVSMTDSNILSEAAAYIFEEEIDTYKYIRLLEEYNKNPENATKEYYNIVNSIIDESKQYNSIHDVNYELGTNYYSVDMSPILNERTLITDNITLDSEQNVTTTFTEVNSNRKFLIKQGYGKNSFFIDDSNFKYNTYQLIDDISVYIFGDNQDSIYEFIFMKNNIKFLISSDKPWKLGEIKNIIKNL